MVERFAFPQSIFGRAPPTDIGDRPNVAANRAVFVVFGVRHDEHPGCTVVGAEQADFGLEGLALA